MTARWNVVGREGASVVVVSLDADCRELGRVTHTAAEWPHAASAADPSVRWVWSDAPRWYPTLLDAGVYVSRCHDLRLCHAILRSSAFVTSHAPLVDAAEWDAGAAIEASESPETLFDFDDESERRSGVPDGIEEALEEFRRQQSAVDDATDAARLRLLLAAESAGALHTIDQHPTGGTWIRTPPGGGSRDLAI